MNRTILFLRSSKHTEDAHINNIVLSHIKTLKVTLRSHIRLLLDTNTEEHKTITILFPKNFKLDSVLYPLHLNHYLFVYTKLSFKLLNCGHL